jgi:hypothetical protein
MAFGARPGDIIAIITLQSFFLGGLEGLVFRAPAILEQSPRMCALPFHSVPIGDSQPPRMADVTSSPKERRPKLERLPVPTKLQELSGPSPLFPSRTL